tara:strand:- start:926 stop:1324 length:399 start_codon:yes stop_codon:yes gene_type:complete
MAAAITQLVDALGGFVLSDTAVTNTVVANATVGGAGATTNIFHIEFDNTANAAVTYLKIYENVNPTMGGTAATDEPSFVLAAAASTKEYVSVPSAIAHSTGFSYIATTTQAEAGSPSAPASACSLAMIYTKA